jgi:hypothetical protein
MQLIGRVCGVAQHETRRARALTVPGSRWSAGPAAVTRLRAEDWLVAAYLAVAVTAVAFVLWYSSVRLLTASRAGLLAGVAPVAAAAFGIFFGGPAPRPLVWAGMALVATGLGMGLPARWRAGQQEPRTSSRVTSVRGSDGSTHS